MIWLRSLRGCKVICNGRYTGRVVQGTLCDTMTALDGLWIDRGLRGIRFVSAEHICVVGENSVVVDHTGERLRIKPKAFMVRAVTTDGMRLGAAVDAGIDGRTLAVEALAINTGWFEGLFRGLKTVRRFKYDIASSRVIVPVNDMETEVNL